MNVSSCKQGVKCAQINFTTGDKNISILHSPCRTSDLQFSLVLQTHSLVLKNCMQLRKWGGGGGFDVFEVSYITLHSILSLMLQLSFSKSRLLSAFSAGDILAELRPSRRKFNNYSDTVCQTYFIDENALRKNQYLLRYSLPHYRALNCAAFIRHLQSQHPVSTFRIEIVCGSMKTLSAIQKMLVLPADFSTRPEGRALWEESLVLSKIHS